MTARSGRVWVLTSAVCAKTLVNQTIVGAAFICVTSHRQASEIGSIWERGKDKKKKTQKNKHWVDFYHYKNMYYCFVLLFFYLFVLLFWKTIYVFLNHIKSTLIYILHFTEFLQINFKLDIIIKVIVDTLYFKVQFSLLTNH